MLIRQNVAGKIKERDVISYEMSNECGFQVNILNYGGIITHIFAPDRQSRLENVVLNYMDLGTYEDNPSYLGAIIGRTSGRVCEGRIDMDGKVLEFNKNYGLHQGHGGNEGFNKKFWVGSCSVEADRATLSLRYSSPDGEENYPGNLEVRVDYTITNSNELIITYHGKSDRKTLLNLTSHSYFNLSGDVKEYILNHKLLINSDYLLELDETQVPTGGLMNVEGTPFDFREFKEIGRDIDNDHPQIRIGSGYDHPWVLNRSDSPDIQLYHEKSGRALDVFTNQSHVVVYTMNFPDDKPLSTGRKAYRRDGICLETQSPPIGRNQAFLENSILDKGEVNKKKTRFRFYVVE